ncbi:MAG: HEAT repeat domain-containing protein [Planctomycetota bacterium]|jgi:hypothetical protein
MSRLSNAVLPCLLVLASLGVLSAGVLAVLAFGADDVRTATRLDAARPQADADWLAEADVSGGEDTAPPRHAENAVITVAWTSRTREAAHELLLTLCSSQVDPRARHEATTGLVDLLRQSPKTAELLADRLLARDCGAPEAGRLLACLAAAGTHACQTAIGAVVSAESLTEARRSQALRSLASVLDPVADIDTVLRGVADTPGPLAPEALEVWAVLTGRGPGRGPNRFGRVAARVEEMLATASGPDELRRALDTLGHLGLPEVPTRVVDAANGLDADVRAAAMRAMRRLDTPDADAQLLRSVRDDPAAGVRWAALESIAYRKRTSRRGDHPSVVANDAALRAVAEADASERVRYRANELLAE